MFRNRQPAWPYRCTGKDARTGVFFFALRAGAARAFPAAGHARGREAAASPAANTAARRKPARGANRARPTRACTPRDGMGGGIPAGNTAARPKFCARRKPCAPNPRVRPAGWHGRRHRRQRTRRRGEGRRAAQIVRVKPERAPHGTVRAATSPAANTAARPKFCARRKPCAPNPRVRPAGWHGRRHRRQRTRRRGESRCAAQIVCAKPFRTAQNDRALQLLPF